MRVLCLLLLIVTMPSLGCGDHEAASAAFRELQGSWRLDPQMTFDATLDGNLLASFVPREKLESARDDLGAWPRLSLRIESDGRVRLENTESEYAATGNIEDTGHVFLARFFHDANDDPRMAEEGVEAVTRVTLELRPEADRLHARVVGAEAEGVTEGALAFLNQLGILHWARLVFLPAP